MRPQSHMNFRLPESIYASHLKSIKGITFTKREVDIIACIVGKIDNLPSFFAISSKTVDTHKRNIKGKMGINTQDGILDFVEQSAEFSFIKELYLSLRCERAFEQKLKTITHLSKIKGLKGLLIGYFIKEGKGAFEKPYEKEKLESLQCYLNKVGIQTTFDDQNAFLSLADIESKVYTQKYDFVIIYDSSEFQQKKVVSQILSKECGSTLSSKIPFIRLCLRRYQNTDELSSCNSEDNSIIWFNNDGEDFLSYFHLLKILLPNIDEKSLILEFKEQVQHIWEGKESSIVRKEQLFKDFFKNKKYFFSIIVILFLCIVMLTFFAQNRSSIRSNLIIPTDTVFLKRPDLIKQIDNKLKGEDEIQTVALMGIVGMGGVGKTTLARVYGKSQTSLVWELNAETKESLMMSFNDLAYALSKTKDQKEDINFIQKVQNQEEKEKQIIFFVKSHLREHPNWILIFDNVENFEEIKSYLPQDSQVWGPGRVIITTRDSNLKNTNYIKQDNIVEIGQLTEKEALVLLSKILYNLDPEKLTKDQTEKAIEFLKNIPPFPLDISIAAYYIKNTNYTYEQYLDRIGQYRKDFENNQEVLLKEVSEYKKTRYSIVTSSLEDIMLINPEFKGLLFFISLLDSQSIPKSLLYHYKDSSIVDSFLHYLRKNGLIINQTSTIDETQTSAFSIHRSTQAINVAFLKNLLKKEEERNFLEKSIIALKSYHYKYLEKSCVDIVSLIPHIETLIENFRELKIDQKLKDRSIVDLLLILGSSHYKCSRNLPLAKKYFFQAYNMLTLNSVYLETDKLAKLHRDIAGNCMINNDLDEALEHCKKSKELYSKLANFELSIIDNLQLLGAIYRKKNNFKESDYYLNDALKKISKITNPKSIKEKKELESEINSQLGKLYSSIPFKKKSEKAIQYVKRSLSILDASTIFSNNLKKIRTIHPSCSVILHKLRLGNIYSRIGNYDKATKEGFLEAKYIMEHTSDYCAKDSLLEARILEGLGESSLRKENLLHGEDKLTKCISKFEESRGKTGSLIAKTLRAETKIRLGNLTGAYEDCKDIFQLAKKEHHNYPNLVLPTSFYHAAIIKYKQRDFQKSTEYFEAFFKNMKFFCENFLDEKEYKKLEENGVFSKVIYSKDTVVKDITQYLRRSVDVFIYIYGADHPFVQDYVMKNSRDASKIYIKIIDKNEKITFKLLFYKALNFFERLYFQRIP